MMETVLVVMTVGGEPEAETLGTGQDKLSKAIIC